MSLHVAGGLPAAGASPYGLGVQPITEPDEWRRRAGLAVEWLARHGPDAPLAPIEGWPGQDDGEPDHLGAAGLAGLAALERGDDPAELATWCRRIVWGQPEDLPGLVVVPPDGHLGAGAVLAAHAGPQPFRVASLATWFLARSFEAWGRDDDLAAAAELHDLVVAMGDDVWDLDNAPLGAAAATLYGITGEDAFLATAERMADLLCEAVAPEGSIQSADPVRSAAEVALVLGAMADAVDDRRSAAIDEEPASGDE